MYLRKLELYIYIYILRKITVIEKIYTIGFGLLNLVAPFSIKRPGSLEQSPEYTRMG